MAEPGVQQTILTPARRIVDFIRSPFPYYFNDHRKNTLLCAGIGLFLTVFMLLFQRYHYTIFVISAVTFAVLWFNIVLLARLLPATFDAASWTVGKYMVFSIWQLLMDGLFICIALELLDVYPTISFTRLLGLMYYNVLIHALIPIAMATLLFRNNVLKQHLDAAMKANAHLDKIRQLRGDARQSHEVVTLYADTRESLQVPLADLLYIEASENYSTVFWAADGGVQSRMLRAQLKKLEAQLDNHFTIRCHRSYLVNVNAIDHIAGNANGYKLSLRGTGFAVPVSRAKGKEVIDRIGEVRDMLALG